jgi:diguanylate cyclase (GGDEF)-like protein/PAS domain S-box-containing protein
MVEVTLFIGSAIALVAVWLWKTKATLEEKLCEQLDITQRQDSLHRLIEGTVGTTGETFFYGLTRELSKYLLVDAVLIAGCTGDKSSEFKSISFWCDHGYIMNQRVSLEHAPFEGSDGLCYLETNAYQLFPGSTLLRAPFNADAFMAIKLQNSSGNVIGLLVAMHRGAFYPSDCQVDMIKLFSSRIASELERQLIVRDTLRAKERAQITLHSIGDGVITTDNSGCIEYMNPIAEALTGWSAQQAIGLSMEAVLHLEDEVTGQVIPDPAMRCLAEKRVITPKTDNVLISRSGERYSIQGTAAPVLSVERGSVGVVLVFKDVTDSRRVQKNMVYQATHDPLTGLVNRVEFENRLENSIKSAKEFENTHALLFLDLDQFKIVNDSVGHAAGDELLKQVSSVLANQLRGRDTLGRLGGDEFSVLLENCPLTKASKVAEILIDAVMEYRFIWEEKTFQIGVSIGAVTITADSDNKTELMNNADQACYAAKDLGRGRFFVFDESDSGKVVRQGEKLQLVDLQHAIENESFELLYQPIVALDEEATRIHTRAEVLLRMLDYKGGHIPPGSFLPSADRFGLMTQIDRWVIAKVFTGYPHIFMQNPGLVLSVNLSVNAVADKTLPEFIIQLFNEKLVQPHQICFEITETALINALASATHLIERLRGLGCSFAIDDFGSSLSTFSILKQLNVDFIKIDGNYVRDVCDDAIDCTMVRSINEMAHILGVQTIAECADSEAIIQVLRQIGVNYAQGYYLGNPVPLDSITTLKEIHAESEHILIN